MRDLTLHHELIISMNNNKDGVFAISKTLKTNEAIVRRYCDTVGIVLYPKTFKGTCNCCGKQYEATRFNVKFCSDKCRNKYNSQGKKKIKCYSCGIPVESAKGTQKKMCAKCRKEQINKKKIETELSRKKSNVGLSWNIEYKECKCCGGRFIISNHNNGKMFCSDYCREKQRRIDKRTCHSRKCKECGKHYDTYRKNGDYCSSICAKKYTNREKEHKRRIHIKTNGRYDTGISIERLIKRDGYNCYICGIKTDRTLHSNHNDYPSIEHVKPLSKGGTHTWDNVKLACRNCNSKKGTKKIKKILEAAALN